MKNLFFVVPATILFGFCSLIAQNNDGNNFNSYYTDQFANIVPPTPNAANFMQYGNTPVNVSSGLPSISIPIYTLEEDGIQVPISISYNASGIKVDDISSTVGLKWSLNAGGAISRTINDLDDFEATYGWNAGGLSSHFNDWLEENPLFDYDDDDKQINFLSKFINDYDNFPDDFNYNFLSYSGDFMFNPNGNVIKSIKDNLIIDGASGGFSIRDFMGNSFGFDVVETNHTMTRSYKEGEDNVDFQKDIQDVGWMLKTIETKNLKEIKFEYLPYTYVYDIRPASQRLVSSFNCSPSTCTFPLNCSGSGNSQLMEDKLHATGLFNTSYNQLIEKIYTDIVEIKFVYIDSDIIDNGNTIVIEGWKKRLDRIIIKDKIAGKEKMFLFKYGVYNGDARLKLLEIREVGFDGSEKPPYKFIYNENGGLPQPGSLAKDYKGYYNGKNNNNSLLPRTAFTLENKRIVVLDPSSPPVITYPGYELLSDRNFNENYMSIGVMNKIEYPTGGATEFQYEPNASGTNTNEAQLEESGISISPSFTQLNDPDAPNYKTFNVLVEMDNIVGKIKMWSEGDCPVCGQSDYRVSRILLFKYNGNINDSIDLDNRELPAVVDTSIENSYIPRPNDNGLYLLQLRIHKDFYPPNVPSDPFLTVNLTWYQKKADTNGNILFQKNYFGGLRIKEIKDIDVNNQIYNHKKFNYINAVEGDYSDLMTSENIKNIANQDIFSTERILLPGSQLISGYYYSEVEIINQNNNNFSRILEKYSGNGGFKSLSNADLIERRIFNENEELQEVIENEYVTETYDTLSFMTPSLMNYIFNVYIICSAGNWIPIPKAGYFNPDSSYQLEYMKTSKLLNSTKSTQFLMSGTDLKPLTKVTNYEYDDDLQVESETIDTRYTATLDTNGNIDGYVLGNTDGRIIQTEYHYTKELKPDPIPWTVPDGLPISKEVFDLNDPNNGNDDLKILGQYFEYDAQGNIQKTYRYNKGGGTHSGGATYVPADYELDVSYLTDEGKPTQVRGQDGVITSYIWGYNEQYPVAKIVGLSYAIIPGATITNIKELSIENPYDEEDLIAALNGLRSTYPNAQVTTYTYNPMVGVSTITDPKGMRMDYSYDGLGRLQYVKDQDENILGKNEYHYKN